MTGLKELRKRTILPRNHDKFLKDSYFFPDIFNTFGSIMHRRGGTYCFRTSIFGTFLSNRRKNRPKHDISLVEYRGFLLFIKSSLELGSSVPLKIWTPWPNSQQFHSQLPAQACYHNGQDKGGHIAILVWLKLHTGPEIGNITLTN